MEKREEKIVEETKLISLNLPEKLIQRIKAITREKELAIKPHDTAISNLIEGFIADKELPEKYKIVISPDFTKIEIQ